MSQRNQDRDNLEISKLGQLTDEQLRNKIIDINNAQLSKIRDMSYYYLIGKSGKLIQFINDDKFLNELKSLEQKEILIKFFDIIINSFKKFHTNMTRQERDKEIEQLLDIRKELCSLSSAIHGYEIELSYIKELLDHYTMKVVGKEEYRYARADNKEITLLINKVGETLDNNTTDHFLFINIVSNILNILPFRMSKSKYFDVVKTTLIRNFNYYPVGLVENQIEEYKILFDGSLGGNYGIIFIDYFTSIQRLKNINFAELTLDELENTAKNIIDLSLNINKVRMFINSLGLLVNRLIVIHLIKEKNTFNSNNEDVFSIWEKYEAKKDKDLLISLTESSNKKLIEMERQLLDDIKYFETLNEEGIKRAEFFGETLNKEMLFTRDILAYYNDVEFTKYEILFPENNEPIDGDYLEQLVDNLIQYINRSIVTMDNIERKIRMRRLLSVLELPFINIEEFLSYIEYSLDERMVSKEEILFTMDAINYWLDGLKEEK